MKKNILIFGGISGLIVSLMILLTAIQCYHNKDFSGNMLLGYTFMLIAFSFVFVGIKNYRDKFAGGTITFNKSFQIGILIALFASTVYVLSWLIAYYFFVPDFMDKMADFSINSAKTSGKSTAEVAELSAQMDWYKEVYKNPVMVIMFTYLEILPVGLIVTLISSFILKKNKLASA